MHKTSMDKIKIFVESFDKKKQIKILDVGGVDPNSSPNSSYRSLFLNHNCTYETLNVKFDSGYSAGL